MCVETGISELSVFSTQFSCEPKTTLKNTLFLSILKFLNCNGLYVFQITRQKRDNIKRDYTM